MYKFLFPVVFMLATVTAKANVIKYPVRAENLRIGGEVNVLYDVNKIGRVENIRLISAEPPDVFDRSVRKQISYWKFSPGNARKDEQLRILFKAN
ncbi:MAG: TonB family protein [Pantoea sp.]|uniref:TonB family protein n=1 Tax=Pantoea sp. TaxID=69393 RepID=UPI00290E3073|nr:TonB family protein [Pantoea sp.]MDU5779221.1 TonB family protein [Pantoea sp.]